ncbi:MAG: sigma-54-dependent Fis family transcriptional regulator, partial [Deferribacteres bacterium]|nr:sigma-54-dependent Fis family transcriptional regulator [Deferribacteres bacterium]
DGNAIEELPRFKAKFKHAEIIMITAYEKDAESAVTALKRGAFDYLTKPFKLEDLSLLISKAAEKAHLKKEYESLKKKLKEKEFEGIVGISDEMQEVFEKIRRVAKTNIAVLITGESGTGKELVARTIHKLSNRPGKFVAINCAAIPSNLLESELFGYEKGAFTGAAKSKKGLLEEAHKGTIFLDEIGDMPLELQGKLLRFLEDGEVRRLGSGESKKVDVRVISATNKNLRELVDKGEFRADLFFRIASFNIEMPPLRLRKEDIPLLIKHALKEVEKETNMKYTISSGALKALLLYDYPGNVRELKNIIRQAALMSNGVIMFENLPEYVIQSTGNIIKGKEDKIEIKNGFDLEEAVAEYEKKLILKALEKTDGVKKKAAEILGISFRQLRYKLEKYGIK